MEKGVYVLVLHAHACMQIEKVKPFSPNINRHVFLFVLRAHLMLLFELGKTD